MLHIREKRGFSRLKRHLDIVLISDGSEYPARLIDISESGMCFSTCAIFAVEQTIRFQWADIPALNGAVVPVVGKAVIRRIEDKTNLFFYGAEFLDGEELYDYVAELKRTSAKLGAYD